MKSARPQLRQKASTRDADAAEQLELNYLAAALRVRHRSLPLLAGAESSLLAGDLDLYSARLRQLDGERLVWAIAAAERQGDKGRAEAAARAWHAHRVAA